MIKKMISVLAALIVLLCLFSACSSENEGTNPQKDGQRPKKEVSNAEEKTAAVIGDKELSGVELSYFYIDVINNYCNQYGDYLQYFIDTSIPLDEQFYDEESGQTWADYFVDLAVDSAKNNYALYNAAKATGHTLSAEEQATTEELFSELKTVAKSYGYRSANAYLEALYGDGASLESYKAYYEVTALASSYYVAYSDQLEADLNDPKLREYEADKMYEYNSYTFASYYMSVDAFKKGGTKDAEGNTVYSDAEIAAAEEALKTTAKALAVPENNTLEALNAAIAAADESAATELKDVPYANVYTAVQEWIRGERREGDIAALPYTTTFTVDGKEAETLKGYYVVLFQNVNDNTFPLKNVRHILVSYEGGTTDETGVTVYSDDEKNAAKEAAEKILKEWESGAKTEDSFAALAKEKTTDTISKENGGLYEAVYPGQMTISFENWCFDDARQPGDTGMIQTDYGYHVMYFCGDNELSYRDYMVRNDLLAEAITDWQTALNDATSAELKSSEHLELDLVLNDIDEG